MVNFFERLKQRKLVQWVLAYAAFAFALIQGLDVVENQFGCPERVRHSITLALVFFRDAGAGVRCGSIRQRHGSASCGHQGVN